MVFSPATGSSYLPAPYKTITDQGAMQTSARSTNTIADQNTTWSVISDGSIAQKRRTSLSSRSPNPPLTDSDRNSDQVSSTKTPSSGISSHHSSLSAPREYKLYAHPMRKLRSQYPPGKTENHVEYILVASFDTDRGPVMEHQYPVAITGDETMLAELMLPDQAHIRNQDWTIFFLHKDANQVEEEAERKDLNVQRRQRKRSQATGLLYPEDLENADFTDDDSSEDDLDHSENEGAEGPPLIYVLNLVNTKQDRTAKRGAVVKAMAICTRHPFLHIYKAGALPPLRLEMLTSQPLLLLALDEYFKSPYTPTLAQLWEAVNNMDLSLMPRLGHFEKVLLQGSDNKDLFVEKFEQMIQIRMAGEKGESPPDMSNMSLSSRSLDQRPDLTRNGTKAHVKAHSMYSVPRDTHEFETKVNYNGIPIPIKVPVALSPEMVGDFSLIKLIQTFGEPHIKSPQPFALHPHLTTSGAFTHPIIVLVNAILTQKRVIFLGYNRPSGEVAEAVLAACALTSGGILRGFTRHAFPYTDLSKIEDLLKIPGFLAGVTNPAFENHPEWWDVLCDLPSGRIKISSRIEPAPITEGFQSFKAQNPTHASALGSAALWASDPSGDVAFMADITRSIAARHGEGVIRAKWHEWVAKFTRVAAAFEEIVYGTSALCYGSETRDPTNEVFVSHGYVWPDEASKLRELTVGIHRIEAWRLTRSYASFKHDLAQSQRHRKTIDLQHLHDRLRMTKLSISASREIYMKLSENTNSYDEICELLAVAPESHAGLFYVALGLFHKDKDVRAKIVELLEKISEHEAGKHWWKSLSTFEKLAFNRIRRELVAEIQNSVDERHKHHSGTSYDS
ncbi:hypothetical protein K3495_g5480 [Podosphaera aphanis]|nr:hypothetical protein K3495_g5480 [Podosphaera aphanis]